MKIPLLLIVLLFSAFSSHAEQEIIEIKVIEERDSSDSEELEETHDQPHQYQNTGEWDVSLSLGYGQVESIIANVDDYNLYLLPSVSYYGEKFFIENTTIGYSLLENESLYIDLVGRLNDDGIYFKLDDFGVFSALGVPVPGRDPRVQPQDVKRDLSYLAGIAVNYSVAGFDLRSGYYHDISDVHNGYEVDLSITYGLALTDDWSLAVSGTAIHKSQKLLNYYYGITAEEGISSFFTYQPNSSGNNYALSIDSEYKINSSWSWQLNFRRSFLSNEISDSLIIDKKHADTYFLGMKYRF